MHGVVRQLIACNRRFGPLLSTRLLSNDVTLTKERYPNLSRKEFSPLTDKDVNTFESIVGKGNVLQSDLEFYNTDWLKTVRGQSEVVLRPESTEEVSAILKYCNERTLAVCPQGGNTGLVGGSVPVFDEVVISTARMNKVINIDPTAGVLMCQAGCILENVDKALSQHDLMMPLDLGAKGSCHIGGNLSTNAGGIRLIRYGSLHGSVLGLEVVLANGDVINNMNPLIKDNTGYDLKQLFIGAEGTLGFITAATIKCPTKPNSVNSALIAVETFADCLKILSLTKKHVGEILSAFEFLDLASRHLMLENLELPYPIAESPFYLLIETSGSNEEHDKSKLDALLQYLMDNELITDGTVAQDHTQYAYMWNLRERMAEGLLLDGYCFKYDLSLPLAHWYGLVEDLRERLKDTAMRRVVGYGHLGDGNLHLNITCKEYSQEVMDMIEPYVYDWTRGRDGSISAEHGLGFKKRQYIYHSKTKEMVHFMKILKTAFDPKGILNPYKYLPDD